MAIKQRPDSPTNNFCTLNPLTLSNGALSEGNTKFDPSGNNASAWSTFAVNSGKWYWEVEKLSGDMSLFLSQEPKFNGYSPAITTISLALYMYYISGEGNRFTYDSTDYDFPSGFGDDTNGTVYNFFLDFYAGTFKVRRNNDTTTEASFSMPAALTAKPLHIGYSVTSTWPSGSFAYNFGQDPTFGGTKTSGSADAPDANGIGAFYYQPPTGALALCTANLQKMTPTVNDDVPKDYFKTVIWPGDGNYPRSISTDFAPDLIWTKARTVTPTNNQDSDHLFMDSVRGDGNLKWISTSYGGAEGVYYDNANADLTSSGFIIQSTAGTNCLNDNNAKFVAWCFRAGGPPDLTSSPTKPFAKNGVQYETLSAANITAGTITPTAMSVNTDAGFSIVKWQASNGSDKTVPHGLSNSLDMIVIKNLDTGTYGWHTSHIGLTTNHNLLLSEPDPSWNPFTGGWVEVGTGGVFNIKNGTNGTNVNNGTDNYIAYCWHSVEGYSKFGSYIGNGSPDGPFVYCGFRPAFLLAKRTTSTGGSWELRDSIREPFNDAQRTVLFADTPDDELTDSFPVDFVSNGFKVRNNGNGTNSTDDTYIFMAFAEQPFNYANAR